MAFPIPQHLPRKKDQDVSTKLLSKMSETTFKSLTRELASSWVAELDVAISQTKARINERIQADYAAFEKQFSSSKSVQERLASLSTNVDQLSAELSDPKTGLIPNLILNLTRHAALAQDATDAHVEQEVVSYLAQCRNGLQNLAQLVQEGRLPDAMRACGELDTLLDSPPSTLRGTDLHKDFQRTFRASKDRTDEQLNDAYSRSIVVNASEIVVRTSVQVRASQTILPIQSVVSSLALTSLNSLISTLRRNLTTHYVTRLLQQSTRVDVSSLDTPIGGKEHRLTAVPTSPPLDTQTSHITNLSTILDFLNQHLFPNLPATVGFPLSLSKPITSAVLNDLLVASLPSSVSGLPTFLELMDHAIKFEQDYIGGVLGDAHTDKDIKKWAGSVAAHYERKRRVDILERTRTLVLRPDDESTSFRITVTIANAAPKVDTSAERERASSPEDLAWGFEEDKEDATVDEDSWGFSDEEDKPKPDTTAEPAAEEQQQETKEEDAWGWNDDEGQSAPADGGESSDWDDPWDEPQQKTSSPSKPKTASRLEKLSNKGKLAKEVPPPSMHSPVPVPPPPPTPAMMSSGQRKSVPNQARVEQESYMVSGRAKELLTLLENVLHEASELASSAVLAPYAATNSSQIGNILYQASTQVLDLHRALYPVAAASILSGSPKWSMYYSNDCLWLSEQVTAVASRTSIPSITRDKLREAGEVYKLLADSWYDDTVSGQERRINATLDKAEGFIGTTDQDRFDECEAAVNSVLQNIRRVAQQCKTVLTKSKYYQAIGSIINTALGRILGDILALPDITEVESHKLSELCRILNALEGLFVEGPEQPSFVVAYVPLWLKYSYLSELLEASIADISYLFEEGALVDFEIGELVNLIKALFADTPLRTNTINKLMQGHPPVVSYEDPLRWQDGGIFIMAEISSSLETFEASFKEAVMAKRLSVSTMKEVTNIALKNMEHDTHLVSLLYRTHKTLTPTSKIHSLYVFDSLSRAARHQVEKQGLSADLNSEHGNCATFLLKVEGVLDGLFQDMVASGSEPKLYVVAMMHARPASVYYSQYNAQRL
ncbi:hypothetical protein NM688_g1539 [Phlebia brevispora]|uniref:Uncharacterized protein n=1 Tax=Phlebia brevispora TaxID=194682 RepID=A0ACC1TBE7_9APHY|nr:hypothetical protein NM688_g1539 [Phlebia brevispora]